MGVFARRDFPRRFPVEDDLQRRAFDDPRVKGEPLEFGAELETEFLRGLETDPAIKPLAINDQRLAGGHGVIVGAPVIVIENRFVRTAQAQVNVLRPVEHRHFRSNAFDRLVGETRLENRRNSPALIEGENLRFVIHAVVEDTGGGQALTVGQHVRPVHVREPDFAGVGSGLVRGKSDGDHTGGMAGDHLSSVAHALVSITDRLHTTLQIEFATIVLW